MFGRFLVLRVFFFNLFLVLLVLMDLASETAKFVFPSKRFETRNLEEALMSGDTLHLCLWLVLLLCKTFFGS